MPITEKHTVNCMSENRTKKLEILGRAQHEAARRRKSDWGTVKGLKFRSQQSYMARTQLHYHIRVWQAQCNVKLGRFEMRQQNFVVCKPKFTNVFAFDVKSIVVVNAVLRLSISLPVLEIYAIEF